MEIEFERVYLSEASDHAPIIKRRMLYLDTIGSIGESIVASGYTVLYTSMGEIMVNGDYETIKQYITDERERIEEEERNNRIIRGEE